MRQPTTRRSNVTATRNLQATLLQPTTAHQGNPNLAKPGSETMPLVPLPQKLKIPVPDTYQGHAGPPPCQCVGHAQIVSDAVNGG